MVTTKDGSIIEYDGERYYVAEAAALYLGKSRAWLYNQASFRNIRRYTFDMQGKRRYFRQRDLDAIRDSPPREVDHLPVAV